MEDLLVNHDIVHNLSFRNETALRGANKVSRDFLKSKCHHLGYKIINHVAQTYETKLSNPFRGLNFRNKNQFVSLTPIGNTPLWKKSSTKEKILSLTILQVV